MTYTETQMLYQTKELILFLLQRRIYFALVDSVQPRQSKEESGSILPDPCSKNTEENKLRQLELVSAVHSRIQLNRQANNQKAAASKLL